MSYRIIQWGTGSVGTHALRTIIERPDFELAGVRVYNPDKVGRDAGDLAGIDPTGVLATDDVDAILAVDADCVCYSPLGGSHWTADVARSRTSVACSRPARTWCPALTKVSRILGPDVDLPGADPEVYERLTHACRDGDASFFHVGINPGFAMDLWPMLMTRLCGRIDTIRVAEIVDMRRYESIHMVRDAIGFGLPADAHTPLDAHFSQVSNSPYYLSMRTVRRRNGSAPRRCEIPTGSRGDRPRPDHRGRHHRSGHGRGHEDEPGRDGARAADDRVRADLASHR